MTVFSAQQTATLLKNFQKKNAQLAAFLEQPLWAAETTLLLRGCIEDFFDVPANDGTQLCEFADSSNAVTIDGKLVVKVSYCVFKVYKYLNAKPLIGWFSCYYNDNCNDFQANYELATEVTYWSIGGTECIQPASSLFLV
jgi:hypothetical protein